MLELLASLALLAASNLSGQNAPQRDAPTLATNTAAISGRVTDKGTGRPLPRAIVRLRLSGQPKERAALTDDEGRYEFADLAAGEYALWATAGEMRATHLAQAFGQQKPMELGGRPVAGLELAAGERRSELDLALTPALAIEGRVVDESGEPMADVHVVLTRPDGATVSWNTVYTDDRGEFRLFGLAAGRYRVCAEPQGSGTLFNLRSDDARFLRTCYPASIGNATANDVVISSSDASGIDIRMRRSGTYSISGSVNDAAGAPANGAFVGAIAFDDRANPGGHTTSKAGEFAVTGLVPGRYLLQASMGGPSDPSDWRPPVRELEQGFAPIEIVNGDVTGVLLPLARSVKVTGRVVLDSEPAPAAKRPQMVVYLWNNQHPWRLFSLRDLSAEVDETLRFELGPLYPGPAVVGLRNPPEGWVLKSVRYRDRDITDVPTDLATPEPGPLDLTITNRTAQPSVRVVDDQGMPVTQYCPVILPIDQARWKGITPRPVGEPDRDGVLALGFRLPGEYLAVAISMEDYQVLLQQPDRLESLASVAERITLVEGDRRVLDLRLRTLPPPRD